MSFDGKPVTDHDREVIKRLIKLIWKLKAMIRWKRLRSTLLS